MSVKDAHIVDPYWRIGVQDLCQERKSRGREGYRSSPASAQGFHLNLFDYCLFPTPFYSTIVTFCYTGRSKGLTLSPNPSFDLPPLGLLTTPSLTGAPSPTSRYPLPSLAPQRALRRQCRGSSPRMFLDHFYRSVDIGSPQPSPRPPWLS